MNYVKKMVPQEITLMLVFVMDDLSDFNALFFALFFALFLSGL